MTRGMTAITARELNGIMEAVTNRLTQASNGAFAGINKPPPHLAPDEPPGTGPALPPGQMLDPRPGMSGLGAFLDDAVYRPAIRPSRRMIGPDLLQGKKTPRRPKDVV